MVRIVKKAEERREEIIEAASRLFLVKGYDRTTMKDVMERLQIAKGTIYHYFKSKEELLEAVLDSLVTDLVRQMEEFSAESQGNALERLRYLILNSAAADSHDQEMLDNLHQPGNAGMHIRLLAKIITRQAPIYEKLIRQGCDEGIFTTEFPHESAEFILAAIQFLTDMGIYPWTREQLTRRVAALPALVEAQLRAPEGSFQFLLEVLAKATAEIEQNTPQGLSIHFIPLP
jgi:AcrR family transcriptional regulator